ncbi:MAG: SMC family ATPase [Candidatus Woesearchaeota archaeon]|jgi:exonuclease SbcC
MQIKSLSLKNIRSYSSLDLHFKKGSTLLSGDIGSGKTTILLSLEFALFGLMKGMISGGALLRHGSKDGNVKLVFTIGTNVEQEIIINRSLKRTSTGVSQEAGYIEINGVRKDCTPVELKSQILSILGYPEELITKSKSLIFRYTIYTPQEDMKQIILDSEDDRLEKLTKIFNVEKYKRIKENAENYAREIRAETKILSTLEKELAEFKMQCQKYEMELEDKIITSQKIQVQLVIATKNLVENESKMKEMEDAIKLLSSLKHELNVIFVEQKNLKNNFEVIKREVVLLTSQKTKLSLDLKNEIEEKILRDITTIKDEFDNYKDKKDEMEKKIIEAKSKLAMINNKKEESTELKSRINGLQKCPTCEQQVGENHKMLILEEVDKKMSDLKEKEIKLNEILEKAVNNLKIISRKLDALQVEILEVKEKEQKEKLKKHKELQIVELDQKIVDKNKKVEDIEKEILAKVSLEQSLMKKIEDSFIDEKTLNALSASLKESKDKHISLKIDDAKMVQSIKEISERIEQNLKSQENKNKQIEGVLKKKTIEHWLTNHFTNLVDVIEKHVMASIHFEFKSYFEEWFNMLIEDESMTASIDERFTPKVSQNGYDTEIENLSGGERTAIALAYRLSLNKVINNMISTIQTKDLLILDEPTDGFSSHQLDKVRDVLDALNSKQTIIVSHEAKMESFVDHIIRIRKHEHESEIM